jgi:rhamnosyltransferase
VRSSILILSKNDAANIGPCLQAVFGQKHAEPFETIVVDSGSTDGTLEIVARVLVARAQERYAVKLEEIPAERFHHARTRNYAASLAQGDILIFISQDAIPSSDNWLSALISNFNDPAVGAVYGRQVPNRGSTLERQDTLDTLYGGQRIVKDPSGSSERGYRYYHFSDVNSAIRKCVWQATKFPEDLKVFEDLGIAKQILDGGWKIVYEPRACVYHSHNHTTAGLFKRYFDIGFTFRRLGIWNSGTARSMLKDTWKLLRKKLARPKGNTTPKQASAGIRQDIAKSAGMLLGLNERFLPLSLKRRMSAFRVYD